MSIIIINNNSKFNCRYDEADLPSCDYSKLEVRNSDGEVIGSKPRNIDFLISQMVGAHVRGDTKQLGKISKEITGQVIEVAKGGEYSMLSAGRVAQRVQYALDNVQEYAAKYIMLWHEQKTKR